MEDYIIRKYKDGDEREINDVFNEIFNEKRSLEEWFWKFKKNPLGDVNMVTVAESQGKIIGQYAILPCILKYKDKVLRSGFAVDNFVHPDFRGGMKGIQRMMLDYQVGVFNEAGAPFGLGFPNREAYIVGKRIFKYKDIGKMPVLFRRLHWRLAFKKRFPRLPNFLITLIQYISSLGFKILIYTKYKSNLKGVKIRKVDSFDERFNLFWEKIKEQYNIIVVRDQKYLNWRYSKPGFNYQIFVAESGNDVVGYAVTGIKKNAEETVGNIVDIVVDNTYGVDSALIKRALLDLSSRKVDYALCWMLPDRGIYTILRSFGFTEIEAFPAVNIVYVVFNFEEVDEMYIKETKNWYLTMADSDTF